MPHLNFNCHDCIHIQKGRVNRCLVDSPVYRVSESEMGCREFKEIPEGRRIN